VRLKTVGIIVGLALSALPLSPAADAQPAGKVARVGILSAVNPRSAPWFQAFVQRLGELGYVEGRNLSIEFRNAEGKVDRFRDLAADLVRLEVDVIVAAPAAAIRAARQASSTMPIVMMVLSYDPIALGYVASLARPGGNITGVYALQLELTAKRLELLTEAVPKLTRVAVLWDATAAEQLRAVEAAARSLRVELVPLKLPPYDLEGPFRAATQARAGALLVPLSPVFARDGARIAELTVKNRLPAISALHEFAEAGGLMAYAANLVDVHRQAATYVDKILKGAKPADLPVEQPTRFELILNRASRES
jgi:putative ABC transport system substrate-binding protein